MTENPEQNMENQSIQENAQNIAINTDNQSSEQQREQISNSNEENTENSPKRLPPLSEYPNFQRFNEAEDIFDRDPLRNRRGPHNRPPTQLAQFILPDGTSPPRRLSHVVPHSPQLYGSNGQQATNQMELRKDSKRRNEKNSEFSIENHKDSLRSSNDNESQTSDSSDYQSSMSKPKSRSLLENYGHNDVSDECIDSIEPNDNVLTTRPAPKRRPSSELHSGNSQNSKKSQPLELKEENFADNEPWVINDDQEQQNNQQQKEKTEYQPLELKEENFADNEPWVINDDQKHTTLLKKRKNRKLISIETQTLSSGDQSKQNAHNDSNQNESQPKVQARSAVINLDDNKETKKQKLNPLCAFADKDSADDNFDDNDFLSEPQQQQKAQPAQQSQKPKPVQQPKQTKQVKQAQQAEAKPVEVVLQPKPKSAKTNTKSEPKRIEQKKKVQKQEESKIAEPKKQTKEEPKKNSKNQKPISGKPATEKHRPLNISDKKNYADNQPWVIHEDQEQNKAKHEPQPKSTTKSTEKPSEQPKKAENQTKPSSKPNKSETESKSKSNKKQKQQSTNKQDTIKFQQTTQSKPNESNKQQKPNTKAQPTKSNTKSRSIQKDDKQKPVSKESSNSVSTPPRTASQLPPKIQNSPIGKKIFKAEKEAGETWYQQAILLATMNGFPMITSKDELYKEEDLRHFCLKEITTRNDTDPLDIVIVGPPKGGKSTVLNILTYELLKYLSHTSLWKTTFIFITDFNSILNMINNYEEFYKNIVLTSLQFAYLCRPHLNRYKSSLEKYFLSRIKKQPVNQLLPETIDENDKSAIEELVDLNLLEQLGKEISSIWSDSTKMKEFYELIFNFPIRIGKALKFDRIVFIADHVDNAFETSINNIKNFKSSESFELTEMIIELLNNVEFLISCSDLSLLEDGVDGLSKEFERLDIAEIFPEDLNNDHEIFLDVVYHETPDEVTRLSLTEYRSIPSLLSLWEKITQLEVEDEEDDDLLELAQQFVDLAEADEKKTVKKATIVLNE